MTSVKYKACHLPLQWMNIRNWCINLIFWLYRSERGKYPGRLRLTQFVWQCVAVGSMYISYHWFRIYCAPLVCINDTEAVSFINWTSKKHRCAALGSDRKIVSFAPTIADRVSSRFLYQYSLDSSKAFYWNQVPNGFSLITAYEL